MTERLVYQIQYQCQEIGERIYIPRIAVAASVRSQLLESTCVFSNIETGENELSKAHTSIDRVIQTPACGIGAAESYAELTIDD